MIPQVDFDIVSSICRVLEGWELGNKGLHTKYWSHTKIIKNAKFYDKHFSKIKEKHISVAIDKIIQSNNLAIKDIEQNSSHANWENFVEPLEKIDEKLSRVWSQISHLNSVMNSETLRKEYNKNVAKITNYYSELTQNLKIFQGFQYLKKKENYSQLNPIQKKIVNDELKGFELGGVGLPKSKRDSFKLIKSKLAKLSSQFEENILDSINDFSLHIESKKIVEGIPKDVLDSAQKLAKENNKKGWLFTLDFPSYIPLMQYAKNRKLREDMYRAYATKASELSSKKLDNGPCINEILLLKQKLATLLSYKNFAEMSLATKIANSSNEVVKFLSKLAKK